MTPALIDLSHRCRLEVQGPDAESFLNGLVTCDVKKLKNSWSYGLHLTHKGKIVFDFFLHKCEGTFFIDVDAALKEDMLRTFQKYIVFQKAQITDTGAHWRAFAVIGPYAKIAGSVDKPLWGYESQEVWAPRDQIESMKAACSLSELSQKDQEILRVESATPKFGVDFGVDTIPQEANLYNALSFTKGCYVGQEIVARLEHRGHVSKQLVLLATKELLKRGDKVLAAEDQKEIGVVTSSAISPKYKTPICLATIKYQWLQKPLHHAHRLEPAAKL